jgi:hypothetical protein
MAAKKAGQPTSYNKEYCELIVEQMKAGKTLIEFAALVNVSRRTINNWINEHPEFLRAVELGKTHSETWWVTQGRNGLYDQVMIDEKEGTKTISKLNTRVFELFMHNLFDWSKKAETQTTTTLNVSSSEDSKALTDKISDAFKAKNSFDQDKEPAKGNA